MAIIQLWSIRVIIKHPDVGHYIYRAASELASNYGVQ